MFGRLAGRCVALEQRAAFHLRNLTSITCTDVFDVSCTSSEYVMCAGAPDNCIVTLATVNGPNDRNTMSGCMVAFIV
jgi:hypothetical protein